LPPPSYVRPEFAARSAQTGESAATDAAPSSPASRPGGWRASQDFLAAASLAARYLCWLGVVLMVYGGICAFGAMGIPGLFDRQVFWADRWVRGIAIWLVFLAPAIVCFFLTAKVLGGAAWSFIAGIAVSGIAALGMAAIVLLCLLGLPATVTPLLVAFIPLVLAVATLVYAARALSMRANDPARQAAGFEVKLPPAP
jgi:cation transport ATPase